MAKFNRTFITVETAEEKFLTARVQFSDQIAYERTSRARGWTPERDQAMSNLFMAYSAMQRTGQHNKSWEDFEEYVIDVQVHSETVDTETGLVQTEGSDDVREDTGEVPGDPTR